MTARTPKAKSARAARHDGWTKDRRRTFLDVLGQSGCVRDAGRVAGMSSTSAYRLRNGDSAFTAGWKAALARAQKGLEAVAFKRAIEGRETVIIRKGEEVERRITPLDSILSLLIKRGATSPEAVAKQAEDYAKEAEELAKKSITYEEYKDNRAFDKNGEKFKKPDPKVVTDAMSARIAVMRQRMSDYAKNSGGCPCCHQKLPKNWPQQSIMELMILGVVNVWDARDGWGAFGPTRTRPDPTDVFIPPLR
jgi:hypothetical protein